MAQRIRPLRDLLLEEARAVFHCALATLDGVVLTRAMDIIDALEEADDVTILRNLVTWRRETIRLAIAVNTRGEA